MVKTRSNNTEDTEKQEDSSITLMLREMLEKMNNMQRDIVDLNAKVNARRDPETTYSRKTNAQSKQITDSPLLSS